MTEEERLALSIGVVQHKEEKETEVSENSMYSNSNTL